MSENSRKRIQKLFELVCMNKDVPAEFITYALELEARKKDEQINNELLKKLLMNYSVLDKKLHEANQQLRKDQLKMADDLKAASLIQRSLLPKKLPQNGVYQFDWQCIPCESMGGDLVNVVPYDEENFLVYLVDVSGHGTRAAMITVVLSQFLQPSSGQHVSMPYLEPAKMMRELEKEFPFSRFGSFFTIIYGVLNVGSFTFRYCNSGHPFPMLIHKNAPPEFVTIHGPMLGLGLPHQWEETKLVLSQDHRLLLFTDGITECVDCSGQALGEERLIQLIQEKKQADPKEMAQAIIGQMQSFCGKCSPKDDISFLLISNIS
jgi:sigma-B regulation protein RsbU (phosphoserine phosphatase)